MLCHATVSVPSYSGGPKGPGRGRAPANEGQGPLRARNGEAKESGRGPKGQGKTGWQLATKSTIENIFTRRDSGSNSYGLI